MLGRDKGGPGGSFKMNFQIVNIEAPKSPQNTCVFSIFEAGDSTLNMHVALDRYKDDIEGLNGMELKYVRDR